MKTSNQQNLGKFTAPGEVRFVRNLPGTLERVWEYLTDSEKRGRWLASGPMELRLGGAVDLHFLHRELTPYNEDVPEKYQEMCGSSHVMTGTITRCEPPRLLSYTWGEADGSESEVTFELTPQDDAVLLVLTHRKLGDDRGLLVSVASGWHTHLAILIAKLEGEAPPRFWATHAHHETEYERILSASPDDPILT